MATTANDLIRRAMLLIGNIGKGESPDSDEASDGLISLNAMLDSWSNESLMIYQTLQENFPLVGGTQSYTIGSGGVFNTTRPIRLTNAFIRQATNNIDTPVKILRTSDSYDKISLKTSQSSFPDHIYYDMAYPLGTMYLWPVPSIASTLFIDSYKQLQQFSTLTTAISLPNGYERMIVYNLAMEISPEYGATPSQIVMAVAVESKAAIKRINQKDIIARLDPGIFARAPFNINYG